MKHIGRMDDEVGEDALEQGGYDLAEPLKDMILCQSLEDVK